MKMEGCKIYGKPIVHIGNAFSFFQIDKIGNSSNIFDKVIKIENKELNFVMRALI